MNGELLTQQLIDEINLALAPVICGQGVPLFDIPQPIPVFSKSPFFEIKTYEKIGDMVWINMSVHYHSRHIH